MIVGISATVMWKCHSYFVILAFGCTNNLITDAWREAVLNRHNTLRKRLAEGKQQGKKVQLLAAANMNKLNWDCNMEMLVDENIEKCSAPAAPPQNTYAMTSAEIPIRGECNAINLVEDKLKTWWKEGAGEMTDNNVKADNPFAQMANAVTDGFACSYRRCQGKLFLLCFYNQKAKAAGNALYQAVAQAGDPPCGNCPVYPTNPPGQKVPCVEALCQFPLTEAKIPSTVCGSGAQACVGEFSDEFRLAALDMHNYYRRLLATGWAKDKQITYARPGVKMIELEYNKGLEDKAITNANKCPTTAAGGPGESVWVVSGGNNYEMPHLEAIGKAVKDWWAPVEATGFGKNLEYTTDTENGALKYAANMAYEATTQIGCAVKNCPPQGVTVVDCQYNPAITDGDTIYTTGNKPCSKCRDTQGTTACSTLGGLCVKP
ncbi:hypothetical protein Aduo_017413 [Ancylostoma duodenale]